MSEPKKISFGFSKLTKKTNLVLAQNSVKNAEKKVELIDCLEGQSIKIKDAVVIDDSPLIIPVKGNDKNLLDRVREANELKERSLKKHEELEDTRPDSELTLDELAARQLLREAKNYDGPKKNVKVYSLPAIEDKLVLEGSKEPTINDYENVPISEYGLAMLRGMGWKDGQGIGKSTRIDAVAAPELRPKGMGLGANKMVNSEKQAKPATDKDGKELCLIKGIHAKVIAGKEKGNYCTVQGLDDEGGRVIVKMALKGDILTFNEFLLIPVTADEYAKCSKVLNNAKYEEFKGKTGNQNDGAVKFEKPANPPMKPSRDDRSRSRSNSVENTKSDESNKNSETIKKHTNSDFYAKTVDSEHNEKSRDKKHRDSTDDSDDGRRKKDGENYRSGSKNDDRKDRDDYNDKRSRYDKNSKGDYERRNDKNRDEDYDRRSRNERDNKYRDEDYEGRSRNEKDNRYRDENYERRSRNEKDSRYKDEDYERRSRNEKDSRYKDEDNERKSRKEKDSRHKDDDYDRKSKKHGDEDNQRKSRSDKKNDSDDDYDRKKRDDSSEDRDRRKEKKHKKKKNKSRSRSRSTKRKSRKNDGCSSDEEQTSRKKSSKKKKKSKRRSPSSSSEEDCKKTSRSRRERSYSSDSSSDDDRRRRRKNK